jgi:glycosyltransferase involved in cell wall biosynthesis
VGLDLEASNGPIIKSAGQEFHEFDLLSSNVVSALMQIIGDRNVAAISFLDVLEHLVDPKSILAALTNVLPENTLLLTSIPNISHSDITKRLTLGQWEYTESGLLDETHVKFFVRSSVNNLMNSCGWKLIESADVVLRQSDQTSASLLFKKENLLCRLIDSTTLQLNDDSLVNQFVGIWRKQKYAHLPTISSKNSQIGLSVILRTMGNRERLFEESILCLAAQEDSNFELVIVTHNSSKKGNVFVQDMIQKYRGLFFNPIKIISVDGGKRSAPLNAGLDACSGDYVAFLDDDDVVLANWVAVFNEAADSHHGKVVRSFSVTRKIDHAAKGELEHHRVSEIQPQFTKKFDFLEHLEGNQTPFHSFAVPRAVATEFGIFFDLELDLVEDWDFLLRAASLCGVFDTGFVTAIYQKWNTGSSSDIDQGKWNDAYAHVKAKWRDRLIVLSSDDVSRVELDRKQLIASQIRIGELELEAAALSAKAANLSLVLNSLSWRATAPIRFTFRKLSTVLKMLKRIGQGLHHKNL